MIWKMDLRFDQHLSGLGGKYTKIHAVKRLDFYEEHEDFEGARMREVQIKDWSQEKKKRILIDKFSLELEN